MSFCTHKDRSLRESIANVKRMLTCSCGPKRRKTRAVKEVQLFSESVEFGGEGFGLGDLCRRRASVSRLTCATMEGNDEYKALLFLLKRMRVARLRRKDTFSYPFAFRGAVSVRMRKMADGGRPTHKESRGLEEDLWRQFVEQLSKVVSFSGILSGENGDARTLGGGDEWKSVRCQARGGVR